jgi:hypothetical protein
MLDNVLEQSTVKLLHRSRTCCQAVNQYKLLSLSQALDNFCRCQSRRKDYMINHNESDLNRPGIEPTSSGSQSNALSIELTGLFEPIPLPNERTGYILKLKHR